MRQHLSKWPFQAWGVDGWGKDLRVFPRAEGCLMGATFQESSETPAPASGPGTPGGSAGARRSVWTPASQSLGTSVPVTPSLPFPSNPFSASLTLEGLGQGREGAELEEQKNPPHALVTTARGQATSQA